MNKKVSTFQVCWPAAVLLVLLVLGGGTWMASTTSMPSGVASSLARPPEAASTAAATNQDLMSASLEPVNLLIPLVIVGVLGLAAWAWYRRRQAAPEPPSITAASDWIPVATQGVDQIVQQSLTGSLLILAAGTYGTNQARRLLSLLEACGLSRIVAGVIAIEHDAGLLQNFLANVPAVFHDRIESTVLKGMTGGAGNQPAERVMGSIHSWLPNVVQVTTRGVDKMLRRSQGVAPAAVLLFLSQGGQLPMALPVLDVIRRAFRQAMVIAFTASPLHRVLGERFDRLQSRFDQAGVRGWVYSSNQGLDPITADYGMVAMVAGLADAAIHQDQVTQLNNVFALTFGEHVQPGAVYQVQPNPVPAFPQAAQTVGESGYAVDKNQLVAAIHDALNDIEDGQGVWSADLPVGRDDASTFDIVLVGVGHEHLPGIRDAVVHGRNLGAQYTPSPDAVKGLGRLHGGPNYQLLFASISQPVTDPSSASCPVVVVRLMATAADRNATGPAAPVVSLPVNGHSATPEAQKAAPIKLVAKS